MITESVMLFFGGIAVALVAWTWRKILVHEERLAVIETHLADKMGNTPAPIRRRKILGII